MRKEKLPPVRANLLEQDGQLNRQWLHWFQTVGKYFDDYRRTPDITYSTSATLTTDDFGKSIVFNVGTGSLTCTLPLATSRDLHCWIGPIFRIGTGMLIISSVSPNMIETSSAGGSIMCNEAKRIAANVTLEVVSANIWGITGGTGLWQIE